MVDLDFGREPSGFDVIARLRALEAMRGVCIVAVTGWTRDADRAAALAAGADHYLHKPADPDVLVRLARSVNCEII
jgi:DNA-binding response OmpR family regulator